MESGSGTRKAKGIAGGRGRSRVPGEGCQAEWPHGPGKEGEGGSGQSGWQGCSAHRRAWGEEPRAATQKGLRSRGSLGQKKGRMRGIRRMWRFGAALAAEGAPGLRDQWARGREKILNGGGAAAAPPPLQKRDGPGPVGTAGGDNMGRANGAGAAPRGAVRFGQMRPRAAGPAGGAAAADTQRHAARGRPPKAGAKTEEWGRARPGAKRGAVHGGCATPAPGQGNAAGKSAVRQWARRRCRGQEQGDAAVGRRPAMGKWLRRRRLPERGRGSGPVRAGPRGVQQSGGPGGFSRGAGVPRRQGQEIGALGGWQAPGPI
jgi:hypothetical protein